MKPDEVPTGWNIAANGNSLRIIQWSSDGSKLLLESSRWIHEGDGGWDNQPIIYDAKRRVVVQPEVYAALKKRYGTECSLELSTLGLSSSGEVILGILPWMDVDGSSDGSCLKEKIKLLYDYESGRLQPYSSAPGRKTN